MNLKEAFRYQNILDDLLLKYSREICRATTILHKRHMFSKYNPEKDDVEEICNPDREYTNDDVVILGTVLLSEKSKISSAIFDAKIKYKKETGFDIDEGISSNKYRQTICSGIKGLLECNPKTSPVIKKETDYKFNVEGNQSPYLYDVEITTEDAFNREKCKSTYIKMMDEADDISNKIDMAKVNINVEFEPLFGMNISSISMEDIIDIAKRSSRSDK